MDELDATGTLKITIGGQEEALTKEDLLIESAQVSGYESNSDYGITVVLDTNLSEELIEEGFVREVVSKIQTMRKDAQFEVMDHIVFSVSGNDKVAEIIGRNEDAIKEDVLADEISYGLLKGEAKHWNINGEEVDFAVEKC